MIADDTSLFNQNKQIKTVFNKINTELKDIMEWLKNYQVAD